MANKSILEILSQLEGDLRTIKSASEQVESVLASDTAINDNLKSYARSLSEVTDELQKLEQQIHCDLSSFTDAIGTNTIEEFERLKMAIAKVENMSKHIADTFENECKRTVEKFKESGKDICANMNEAIERSLSTFKSNAQMLIEMHKTAIADVQMIKNLVESSLNSVEGSLDKLLVEIRQADNLAKTERGKLQAKIDNIDARLQAMSASNETSLSNLRSELISLRSQNRILILVAIICSLMSIVVGVIY